jgi:hypothetical protein
MQETTRLAERTSSGWGGPAVMLLIRPVLFALGQALIALVYSIQAGRLVWAPSTAWWPVTAIFSNLVCLVLLERLLRREGRRYRDLLRIERGSIKSDLGVFAIFAIASIPAALIPNLVLSQALFGDTMAASELFLQALPFWAGIVSLLLFPITVALAELPTYYGYAMPRLAALANRWWAGLLLAVLFHAFQHLTLPLIFDPRFILWRALMFLPLALLVGGGIAWRPRLLPYFMVWHGLLDLLAVAPLVR